jgi:hypothetical protein
MKAPKVSFDSAKMQQMLLLHVEKIVLGVVLVAVLWFVYQGATLPKLDESKTPDRLTQEATRMTTEINNPEHWKLLEPDRVVKHDVQGLVKQGQLPNTAAPYAFLTSIKTPDFPKAIARTDPRLFPPEKPKVVALHGPMAMLARANEVDPIIGMAVAPGGEGMQPQPQAQPRQPARPAAQPTRQPPGEGRRPPAGRPKRGGGLLEEGYGEGIPPPGMMQPGGEGMGGAMGARTVPPEAIVGYHVPGEVIAREARAVVIMAAVPLEKQFEEFDKAFKDALEYDPMRDIPRYVLYRVERADVTADPAQDPAQARWESLAIGRALAEMGRWGPSPREVIEVNAIDPILTNPVPPFMQRDIYDALVHPDIPVAKLTGNEQLTGNEGTRPGEPAANEAPVKEQDLTDPNAALPIPGAQAGQGMGEGMPRPGMMQRGPGPGFPGMRPGGLPGYGEGMGGVSPGAEMPLAKYRLLRFTDTTVQPLHKYRYRVKLILEDPNNPYVGVQPPRWDPARTVPLRKPPIQSMSANSLTRVRAAEQANDPNTRPFLRETDASEPSDIVELPEVDRYFAGKATPGNGNPLPVGTPPNVTYTPPILSTQPSANLLTVTFDREKAVDVAAEKEIYRGSTLNFEKDADVIHPAKLTIHTIEKHKFLNNSIVVDFVGGNDVPTLDARRSDKVPEPCEILIFDGLGKLQLLDEADDVEGFRRYLPPKPEIMPAAGSTIGPEAEFPGGLLEGPARPTRPTRPGKG